MERTRVNRFLAHRFVIFRPLFLSSAAGHTLVIDELLAAAVNVNCVDALGGSALLEAAKHSQDAIVTKLRDAGAVWHLSTVETAVRGAGGKRTEGQGERKE